MPDLVKIVAGRSCEGCAMCCYLARIDALEKPENTWCQHAPSRKRCAIYDDRPPDCRDFHCGYLTVEALGEEWKPSRSKIMMVAELDGQRMTAIVDPARPDAWRKEPYRSTLRAWAEAAVGFNGQVCVRIGRRWWVILPDGEADLGEVADDELIVTEIVRTATGTSLKPMKLKRDDPRVAGLG